MVGEIYFLNVVSGDDHDEFTRNFRIAMKVHDKDFVRETKSAGPEVHFMPVNEPNGISYHALLIFRSPEEER